MYMSALIMILRIGGEYGNIFNSNPHLWTCASRETEIADSSGQNLFHHRVSGTVTLRQGEELRHPEGTWSTIAKLYIARTQVRWFGHLIRMPLGALLVEVFCAHPTRRKPWDRTRICWRDMAWEAPRNILVYCQCTPYTGALEGWIKCN